jgi:hypothetical protein
MTITTIGWLLILIAGGMIIGYGLAGWSDDDSED